MGHPLCGGVTTPDRFAAGRHILVSRRGDERGGIDDLLKPLGLKRDVVTVVGSFSEALALVRASDLIACVPELYTRRLCDGLFRFPVPVGPAEMTISLLWHPRMDADLAHRWLRERVHEVCSLARSDG